MRVTDYPILPDFDGLSFAQIREGQLHRKWDTATAARFGKWFFHQGSTSSDRLRTFLDLNTSCLDTSQQIDRLHFLFRELATHEAFATKIEQDDFSVVVNRVSVTLHGPSHMLTERGLSIVFDAAFFIGAALLQKYNHLEYKVVGLKRKTMDADRGLPAIFGFANRVHLFPPRILLNCMADYLNGDGRLPEVFNIWDDLAARGV